MKTLLMMSLLMVYTRSSIGVIERVGNPIQASPSGSKWNRTAFLLVHEVPQDGVVFAFSAFFLHAKPVQFEIWRPTADVDKFKLIGGWTFTAVVQNNIEIMYIHSRQGYKCATVKAGDRLGLYTVESPGAVAYTFKSQQPSTKQYTHEGTSEYLADGATVQFDSLVYPYQFSVAAFIDTDMIKYPDPDDVSCPKTMSVPSESVVSTLAPVTPVPGKQGATGESGGDGATGATGPRGAAGPWGANGPTGATGPQGAIGYTGPAGHMGGPGPRGTVGATGAPGPKGDKGDTGGTGGKGDAGPAGPAGPKTQAQQSSLDALLQDCTWCQNLISPYLSLALIIWLIVISIVFVVIVVVVRRHHRDMGIHYQKGLTSGTSQNELWKKYQNTGFDNDGNNLNDVNDEMYAHIDEGRTEF